MEEERARRCKCKGSMVVHSAPSPSAQARLVGGGASFATSRNPRPWRLPIEMLAACNYSAVVLSCRLLYSHLSHPSSPPWKEEEEESHV